MKVSLFSVFFFIQLCAVAQQKDVVISVNLRGVHESKISIMPLSGRDAYKNISLLNSIHPGDVARLKVPSDYLPGEFVIRFDYKERAESTPYPAEKQVLLYNQDIELWVHPIYSNNPDSTWFQKDERENSAYQRFAAENAAHRKMMGLLQEFLMGYDDPSSSFYKKGKKEFEKRRKAHNQWIARQKEADKNLFAAGLYGFEYVPSIDFRGEEMERKQSLIDHYFDGIDFTNPLVVRAARMKSWMDTYVNLHGGLATSEDMLDSLFTSAGIRAIEKAKTGDPHVYGWMVDYFFKGYESFDFQKGLAMLEPYLQDPNCLTEKRQAIEKRLKGMQTLVPGAEAPDFDVPMANGDTLSFHQFNTSKPYKLVIFWSASCGHCKELMTKLYPFYSESENEKRLEVFALTIDESPEEVKTWETAIEKLQGWHHIRPYGGVNSLEANNYFILSTPVMALVDSKTNQIVEMIPTVDRLGQVITK